MASDSGTLPTQRDPRRAYRVVDLFEEELADYCGARHAVCVNSCTNALFLALTWSRMQDAGLTSVEMPTHTYVGVLQSVRNAGLEPVWMRDWDWQPGGCYALQPARVVDAARLIRKGLYDSWASGTLLCLSMHVQKQLPVGRGGAIVTDDEAAVEWLRAARMDGRPPGAPFSETITPAWHVPMPPDVAARGLDILSRWNDTDYSPPPLPHTDYPDLSTL